MTTLAETWERRTQCTSVEELQGWLAQLQGTAGITLLEHAPATAAQTTPHRCQLCSNKIESDQTRWVHFGTPWQTLPVHYSCHESRSGLTPAGIVAALKVGLWLINAMMEGDDASKWTTECLELFALAEGSTLGDHVIASELTWWDRSIGVRDAVALTRLARDLFVWEREAPKFHAVGADIPPWDPAAMSWADYKRLGSRPGPFYEVLRAAQKAHGKPEPKYPPAQDVLDRTGGACAVCGDQIDYGSKKAFDLRRDHIFPCSKGGSNELDNFQPLHNLCNGAAKNSLSGGHVPLALVSGRWMINMCLRDDRPECIDKAARKLLSWLCKP